MKANNIRLSVITALAMALTCGRAGAESSDSGMTREPCPPAPPPQPVASAAKNPFLQPGVDTSALLAQFQSPAMKAAMDKQRTDKALRDWPGLCAFRAANAALIARRGRPRLVLMGDSITESWAQADPDLFGAGGVGGGDGEVVDRGISGQTSGQMLARFYPDVIALKPQAVQIMAGTNDIAGNTGPSRPEDFESNIMAMVDLARANGVSVILASIPPTDHFWWAPGVAPKSWVTALNLWLHDYAAANHLTYVDYYSVLAGPDGAIKPDLSNDGVHPNIAGFAIMRPLLAAAMADQPGPPGPPK